MLYNSIFIALYIGIHLVEVPIWIHISATCRILLSRVGYVTRRITSRRQGYSESLLDFACTIMHFTIIPLMLCVLLSWLTSSVGESIQLSLAVAGSRLLSSAVDAILTCSAARLRLTRSSSKLGFYNLGHCYAMDLLFIRRFEKFDPFHLLGNAFVAPGNGPLLLRCLCGNAPCIRCNLGDSL
jgi:hypothetical protein